MFSQFLELQGWGSGPSLSTQCSFRNWWMSTFLKVPRPHCTVPISVCWWPALNTLLLGAAITLTNTKPSDATTAEGGKKRKLCILYFLQVTSVCLLQALKTFSP